MPRRQDWDDLPDEVPAAVREIAGPINRAERAGAGFTGVESVQDAKDAGGGKLIASLKDADGNVIGLLQPA